MTVTSSDQVVTARISAPGVASITKSPLGKHVDGGFFPVSDDGTDLDVSHRGDATKVRMMGPGIGIEVDRATGRLAFLTHDGSRAIVETAPRPATPGVPIASVQSFGIDDRHPLLGLGQFRDPVLDYRGHRIFLQQSNMDAVNAFLVSPAGWGLLWDTRTAAYMRAEGKALSFDSVEGDTIRYHVCLGRDLDAVIAGYRRLTGAAQLLGKWAYGFWQSKERYASQAELTGVVDRYRATGLPLDNIVLDWRYWGENDQFSGMTFDKTHFPDPQAMVAHVHARDAHIIASVWPAFGTGTAIYRDMAAAGHLFPGEHWSGGKVFDVTAPAARALYWRHIDKGLMAIGMDGLWTDGCEPEFMSTGNRYVTARAYAANGSEAAGPIARNLSTFSYYQSRGLSEAMRTQYPARRSFILTRSVYPGQQAFGAVTWSGDIFASWQTLRNQVIASLNMAASGNPHWTCDIGGFLVFHRYPRGLADPAYKELYVRWFQMGAFLPVFRAHGTDVPRELWQFGAPGDPFYDALAAALRQRYALMPYIYSLAARAALADDTIQRPLAMDYPDDAEACAQSAQFSFGRSLMVRVVDRPMLHASDNIQEFLPNEVVQGIDSPAAEVGFYEGDGFQRLVAEGLTDDLKMSWFGDLPGALRGKPYSVRWRGQIVAPESGRHRFVVTAQGAVRMVVAGQIRLDAQAGPSGGATQANGGVSASVSTADRRYDFDIDLIAGTAYPFILEQRQPTPDAVSLWVEWITPAQRALATCPHEQAVPVYLPRGADWYDYHSRTRFRGGRTIMAAAPLSHTPVFARAGAIIPTTPGIVHARQPVDTVHVDVFAGADGRFDLYDDAGDGDGYRQDERALISLTWDDARRTFGLGAREGSFPGMRVDMRFVVSCHDGESDATTREVTYTGDAIELSLRGPEGRPR